MLGVGGRGRAVAGAAGAYLTRILWPQFPVTAIREIKILKVLNHKNVVQLKEIVTSKGALCPEGRGERGRSSFAGYHACGAAELAAEHAPAPPCRSKRVQPRQGVDLHGHGVQRPRSHGADRCGHTIHDAAD